MNAQTRRPYRGINFALNSIEVRRGKKHASSFIRLRSGSARRAARPDATLALEFQVCAKGAPKGHRPVVRG